MTEQDRQYFKEYIAKQAICLLPDDIIKNLPRQVNRWHYWQWLKIYQAMYFNSGLKELIQALKGSERRIYSWEPAERMTLVLYQQALKATHGTFIRCDPDDFDPIYGQ